MKPSLRSDFLVSVLRASAPELRALENVLVGSGFQCLAHTSVSALLKQILDNPPHVVVLDQASCRSATENVCRQIKSVSNEIRLIVTVEAGSEKAWLMLKHQLGLDHVLADESDSCTAIIAAVEASANQLYLQFENEELKLALEQMSSPPPPVTELAPPEKPIEKPEPSELEAVTLAPAQGDLGVFVREFLQVNQRMRESEDPAHLNDVFMQVVSESLGGRPVVFFKYLPSYSSLLAAQAHGLPLQKIRGIGVNLTKEDPRLAEELLRDPERMPQLRALMREAFGLGRFCALTAAADGEVAGVFVVFTPHSILQTALSTVWQSYGLHLLNKVLIKKNHDLEIYDGQTGLSNRRHFERQIELEMGRVRRINLPCSLIVVSIDKFAEYCAANGLANSNFALRLVAHVLRKTLRQQDLAARLEGNRFALLLPHTPARGGAVKAERLRRLLLHLKLKNGPLTLPGTLTASFGVSEYPATCTDGLSLLESADEAMLRAQSLGGNKICVCPNLSQSDAPARQTATPNDSPQLSQNHP